MCKNRITKSDVLLLVVVPTLDLNRETNVTTFSLVVQENLEEEAEEKTGTVKPSNCVASPQDFICRDSQGIQFSVTASVPRLAGNILMVHSLNGAV